MNWNRKVYTLPIDLRELGEFSKGPDTRYMMLFVTIFGWRMYCWVWLLLNLSIPWFFTWEFLHSFLHLVDDCLQISWFVHGRLSYNWKWISGDKGLPHVSPVNAIVTGFHLQLFLCIFFTSNWDWTQILPYWGIFDLRQFC